MQQETSSTVRWGEWISEGWQMFTERWQVWVVQMLIVFLIFVVPTIPFYVMSVTTQLEAASAGRPPEPPAMFIPLLLIAMPILLLVGGFVWGGLWKTAIKQLRGETISVKDLFSGGDIFLRVIGAFIAIAFMMILGALLCFFPALIVAGLLYFTIPLIVDRNMGVSDALSASYNATKSNWLMFALFAIVVGLLASLGQFACYIGLLVTYPLQFTIGAVAYRDVFGVPGARSFSSKSASTPTSYAGQSWPAPPPQSSPPPSPPSPVFSSPQPLDPAQPQLVINCPQCGAALTRAANFCNFCGASL